jgi:hypothetical protein
LHSHQQCVRVLVSLHPCQNLLLLSSLIMAILTGLSWNLTIVLIYISFITREIERVFVHLLDISFSSLENSLFNSCANFFIGVLILWGLSFWFPCRFWILVSYQMSGWQRFSPILWVVSWVWWLFLLLYRRSLVWRSLICSLLLLDAEPFQFYLGSCSLYLYVPVYFILLPRVISKFLPWFL